jgi:small subunit ribosomal protein S6
MNKYALTLILKPDMEEKARKELLDSVTKKMGENVKEELWGVRDLSYPIQKQTKGYYGHYFFETEPSAIAPLDKSLKMNEDILRYLIVRV